jgi:hypothetical protein
VIVNESLRRKNYGLPRAIKKVTGSQDDKRLAGSAELENERLLEPMLEGNTHPVFTLPA